MKLLEQGPVSLSLSTTTDLNLDALLEQAERFFSRIPEPMVALSGGVDSSLVAVLAARFSPRVVCVTGLSASLSSEERLEIVSFCEKFKMELVQEETHEMDQAAYRLNQPDRCFHCKSELYSVVKRVAREKKCGIVLDGTHVEDLRGHRPGLQAAKEHRICSPFVELGWNKAVVRHLARHLGLPNHDRPAQPCLSSRLAYGIEVTPLRLEQISKAEQALKSRGFSRCRVRHHDAIARIEVPKSEMSQVLEQAVDLVKDIKAAGFTYVTIDLAGLRSGSLLEVLPS
ncbi:MAG: ATP-dependent sacrificial sulfur transferase LarE [Deltaproteobacteria bacterium]|nr:ATP-dependent sacrificial sulfur transferase LarE [Deltaproteobacteria bacterium]